MRLGRCQWNHQGGGRYRRSLLGPVRLARARAPHHADRRDKHEKVTTRRVLGAVLIAVMGAVLPARPAAAEDPEGRFLALVNQERTWYGLAPLRLAGDLTLVARHHTEEMAWYERLEHNPLLGEDVGGWAKVVENVGAGGSVDEVHAALMASPGHRRHILDPDLEELGVGAAWSGQWLWVTQVFRQPADPVAPTVISWSPAPPPEPPAVTETPVRPAKLDDVSPSVAAPPRPAPAAPVGQWLPPVPTAAPTGALVPSDVATPEGAWSGTGHSSVDRGVPGPVVALVVVPALTLLAGRRLWAARARSAP